VGLKVIILAAGKGKRMASALPKVLHQIGGKPMLEHVVQTAHSLNPDKIIVVHGNGGDQVRTICDYLDVEWVEQQQQLGTGHAVMQAMPLCSDDDHILVLYGDVPLISTRLLRQLHQDTLPNGVGLVVTDLRNPSGFGRIVRNELGNIVSIVEHKDAQPWQLKISEVNTGIISVNAGFLQKALPVLNNDNAQHEYYLTDIVAYAVAEGLPVSGVMAHEAEEVLGVNDRWQQVKLERYYQYKQAKKLSLMGVRLADHQRIDIRGEVNIGIDTFVDINCVLEGKVDIGSGCKIGPNVHLKNVTIGDNVEIKANSVVEGAVIDSGCVVGPFARLRKGSYLKADAKVGNFVEVKQTVLGVGSKVNHLSYLGDSLIGSGVNIGAGTITCNYDGTNKYQTQIQDSAFIGSNTSLIAPVNVGEGATVAAGSTITIDVPAKSLAVGRAKQKFVEGWQRKNKKAKEKS
jgi:bifunctional UDP-N-acetylglucosamine pyrophosphorylase / glucosamine-1-phosphate N-acetyltransferase